MTPSPLDPCEESGSGPSQHKHRLDLGPDICVRSFLERAFLDIRITHIPKMSRTGGHPMPYVLFVTTGSTVGQATDCKNSMPKDKCKINIRSQKNQSFLRGKMMTPSRGRRRSTKPRDLGGGYHMEIEIEQYKDCGSCWSELSHELSIALEMRCPREKTRLKTLRGVAYSITVHPGHFLWPPSIPTGGYGPVPKPRAEFELVYQMTRQLHKMLVLGSSDVFHDVGVKGGLAQKAMKNLGDCEITYGTGG